MKNIAVLGSTGSIGTQTLQIAGNDKNINIQWPIEGLDILLSEKDKNHKQLKEQDLPFVY